jgi:hypothetical protein
MGYCSARDIGELQRKARFLRVSSAGLRESHVHDMIITKEAPNYGVEQWCGSADHRFSWSANPDAAGLVDMGGVSRDLLWSSTITPFTGHNRPSDPHVIVDNVGDAPQFGAATTHRNPVPTDSGGTIGLHGYFVL